jgi:hypothetical protein
MPARDCLHAEAQAEGREHPHQLSRCIRINKEERCRVGEPFVVEVVSILKVRRRLVVPIWEGGKEQLGEPDTTNGNSGDVDRRAGRYRCNCRRRVPALILYSCQNPCRSMTHSLARHRRTLGPQRTTRSWALTPAQAKCRQLREYRIQHERFSTSVVTLTFGCNSVQGRARSGRGVSEEGTWNELIVVGSHPKPSRGAKGQLLDSRQRESSINQLQMAESKLSPGPSGPRKCANMRSIFDFSAENAKIADWLAERSRFEVSGDFATSRFDPKEMKMSP